MRSQVIDLQENGFSLVMKEEARLQGEGRMRHLAPYVSAMVRNGGKWSSIVALEERRLIPNCI